VFTGEFRVVTRFKVDANAPAGPGVLIGKLRYQACSDEHLLPPRDAPKSASLTRFI